MIRTWIGAIVSILIVLTTNMFGLIKLQHLLEQRNPTLETSSELLEND